MSRQDKWSLFMIAFTIVIGISALALQVATPSELPGFLFGAFLFYWMGTTFIKDKPMPVVDDDK